MQLLAHTNPQIYTILVVDDNPVNLKMITDYLGKEIGFHMLTAKSGKSGLERARRGQPDIILLDVLMPGMDGFETCHRLKAQPETKDIPVIFMTALSDTKDKVKGFEAGGVDYVTKPIQQEEVLARVITHLRMYDLTHHLELLVDARTRELKESLQREKQLAAQLRQSLAKEVELHLLKSQMIEFISHEFRTPLTVITQAVSLLTQFSDKLSEDQRQQQLVKVNDSIVFVHQLIQDVSLIVNIADVPVTPTAVPWQTLCDTLKEAARTSLPDNRRVAFVCMSDEGTIITDINCIKQIVTQLVANALKFSDPPARVQVNAFTEEGDVVIAVADGGIGIPAGEQEKIFALFGRASNVEARRGLGLGLSMAWELAAKIHGRLAVESHGIDQGSTFVLRFPQAAHFTAVSRPADTATIFPQPQPGAPVPRAQG